MSDKRRRGGRLPRGHPDYSKQLDTVKKHIRNEKDKRQYRSRSPIQGEPEADWWEDIDITDAEFDKALADIEDIKTVKREKPLEQPQPGTSKQKEYTYKSDIKEEFPTAKRQKTDMSEGLNMDFMDEVDAGAQAGANAGQNGGSGGTNIENELNFGQKTKPHCKTYKKSFLVNINNGKDKLALAWTAGAVGVRSLLEWNEGWQMIPWADLRAYLTPTDWYELMALNRKWRIKKCGFKIEGIIPFQVDLSGATNSSTATFNNRINLHIYEDDGELLPTLNNAVAGTMTHNAEFQIPWGESDLGQLPSPNFRFWGAVKPDAHRYCCDSGFANTQPQKYFSLYNTGHVKSCYPGQKFKKEWVNPNTHWVGRVPNDLMDTALDTNTQSAATIDEVSSAFAAQAYDSGVSGTGIRLENTPQTAANYLIAKSHYIDNGVPVSFVGPPYVLIRVEPYPNHGAGGGLINIYAQAHLHYEMEIEMFPMEKPMQYVPLITSPVVAQGSFAAMNQQVIRDTRYGVTDNKVHRVAGTAPGEFNYT